MTAPVAEIGVVGLGVMGRNLSLNFAEHGHRVAVYDRLADQARAFAAAAEADAGSIAICDTLEDLVAALAPPRAILLMVKAGRPVDDLLDELRAILSPGDMIIDGGNAHYKDTARRGEELADDGLLCLGVGISGGEFGARHGPAIMAGGDAHAYQRVSKLLTSIAAEVGGTPCCAHLGPGGAGHFVKMVHNGIEYAVMQAISEIWLIMRDLLGLDQKAMHQAFARWADGPLGSYLIEITADILVAVDAETGGPLLDVIADRAGHKGTGRWTAEAALELGVAAPTLISGYLARALSADTAGREAAAAVFDVPTQPVETSAALTTQALETALRCSVIVAYSEGFDLLRAASLHHKWQLDLAQIAQVWRGGCIIRARMLEAIVSAYTADANLALLTTAPAFAKAFSESHGRWRETIAAATKQGIPVPTLAASLASFDSYRQPRLWTSLVQAQRDYFGAHTYERTDRPGTFHTDWLGEND